MNGIEIWGIISTPILALVGWIMWSLRNVKQKLDSVEDMVHTKMDESAVRRVLNDKIEPLVRQHEQIDTRLDRLESKLDRLIEMQNNRGN